MRNTFLINYDHQKLHIIDQKVFEIQVFFIKIYLIWFEFFRLLVPKPETFWSLNCMILTVTHTLAKIWPPIREPFMSMVQTSKKIPGEISIPITVKSRSTLGMRLLSSSIFSLLNSPVWTGSLICGNRPLQKPNKFEFENYYVKPPRDFSWQFCDTFLLSLHLHLLDFGRRNINLWLP